MPEQNFQGVLELERNHSGFLRPLSMEMERNQSDPRIAPHIIGRYHLREGCLIEIASPAGRNREEVSILSVNGKKLDEWANVEEYTRRTAVDPHEQITLTTDSKNFSMRVVDLVCPVGKGQRALIVSPPKAGKTMLMQQLAHAVSKNHPEIELMVLLVDERPEEVTDIRR